MGDALIYLGAVAAALTALGVVLRFLVVKPLKSWITSQIAPVQRQVKPNGGPQETTRHLIEQTADETQQTLARLDELVVIGRENRELAQSALTLAQAAHERLDRHLESGHSSP